MWKQVFKANFLKQYSSTWRRRGEGRGGDGGESGGGGGEKRIRGGGGGGGETRVKSHYLASSLGLSNYEAGVISEGSSLLIYQLTWCPNPITLQSQHHYQDLKSQQKCNIKYYQ